MTLECTNSLSEITVHAYNCVIFLDKAGSYPSGSPKDALILRVLAVPLNIGLIFGGKSGAYPSDLSVHYLYEQ